MLSGEKTDKHTFRWKNGSLGEARIYLKDGKLKFDFN
jgi:hypothetical protein